jgi:hypothetical protein
MPEMQPRAVKTLVAVKNRIMETTTAFAYVIDGLPA